MDPTNWYKDEVGPTVATIETERAKLMENQSQRRDESMELSKLLKNKSLQLQDQASNMQTIQRSIQELM